MEKLNLHEAFGRIEKPWIPRLAGTVNDCAVKLARFQGEFLWHHHEAEDEMFLVIKGSVRMLFRDRTVELNEGEMLVVPRGVEHCPIAEADAWVLMVEPATTLNTGNVQNMRTVPEIGKI